MLLDELDLFLGKKIRLFRSKYKWPLKTLANDLGVSFQQLQRYELGEQKISATLLYKLSKIFHIKVDSFFEGYENQNEEEDLLENKINIMLIEEDINDEFLLRIALEEFPTSLNVYSIHTFSQAYECFRKLENSDNNTFPKPQLIFLDIMLSHGKGLELLNHIKHKSTLREIPIIIFTNSANATDVKESYKFQASGFIHKSLDKEEFKLQVFNTLNYWLNTVNLP